MEQATSILDACCGPRLMHHVKNDPRILAMDIRRCETTLCDGRTVRVAPDTIADFTNMPFAGNSFDLVIFDPPHLCKAGPKSYMVAKYGKLPKDYIPTIAAGFSECWRVLKPGHTLFFKWSTVQIPIRFIAGCFPDEPIIHTRQGTTHIFIFQKSRKWENIALLSKYDLRDAAVAHAVEHAKRAAASPEPKTAQP